MTLPSRVAQWGFRWHQRVAVRRWPDSDGDDGAFNVEVTTAEPLQDHETSGDPVRLAIDMALGAVDDQQSVRLRGAVKVDDERLLAVQDAEVRILFAPGEELTDQELIEFAQGWGHDYLMGYLRAGLVDSAALVGLPNLILPPTPYTRPSREDAVELLEEARRRSQTTPDQTA